MKKKKSSSARAKSLVKAKAKEKLKTHSHGSHSSVGVRKTARPLVMNSLTEVVLKSSAATGRYSFLKPDNRSIVMDVVSDMAERVGVTLNQLDVSGTELRLIVTFKKREAFQDFLRTTTATIARRVTGARRGKPFGRKFWDGLAFTRVIEG